MHGKNLKRKISSRASNRFHMVSIAFLLCLDEDQRKNPPPFTRPPPRLRPTNHQQPPPCPNPPRTTPPAPRATTPPNPNSTRPILLLGPWISPNRLFSNTGELQRIRFTQASQQKEMAPGATVTLKFLCSTTVHTTELSRPH